MFYFYYICTRLFRLDLGKQYFFTYISTMFDTVCVCVCACVRACMRACVRVIAYCGRKYLFFFQSIPLVFRILRGMVIDHKNVPSRLLGSATKIENLRCKEFRRTLLGTRKHPAIWTNVTPVTGLMFLYALPHNVWVQRRSELLPTIFFVESSCKV